MTGRRLDLDALGATYQDCARFFLGRLSAVTEVPSPIDYGIDFFCQPRSKLVGRTHTVQDLCGLQVKGGDSPLEYGGADTGGAHRAYHFDWMRAQSLPVYLVRVAKSLLYVDVHSLYPIWLVLSRCPYPGRIICKPQEPAVDPFFVTDHQPVAAPSIGTGGDGQTWEVNLGPPLLRITHEDLTDPEFAASAAQLLLTWIGRDRLTVALRHLGVVEGINKWTTYQRSTGGSPPTTLETVRQMTWSAIPGANVNMLAGFVEPVLANLGASLQHQNDPALEHLRPLLEWMDGKNLLHPITKGLLQQFTKKGSG